MYITKIDIAKAHIERAIDLFINEKDYTCSLTLAGAAEQMLGEMLRSKGINNILEELLLWFQEKHDPDITYGKLAKRANVVRDEMKHGDRNPDPGHLVEVSEPLAAQMLMRALCNYKDMPAEPTEKMMAFSLWVRDRKDEIFSEW